jgi:hypothetical protein
MFKLELSDEYGLEGVPNREQMLVWLDSWLRDADSQTCVITKASDYTCDDYVESKM